MGEISRKGINRMVKFVAKENDFELGRKGIDWLVEGIIEGEASDCEGKGGIVLHSM